MSAKPLKRREFLKTSTAIAVGTGSLAGKSILPSTVLGANEKITVGVIGSGRMGRSNIRDFIKIPGVEIAALCDVFEPALAEARELLDYQPDIYKDWRRIIERKDIDVVLNATPDHWHALPTILACQEGKDVYVEKPISHNIVEGRTMVKAARKYNRVVQVGTQQRSGTHYQRAVQIVKSGKLGHISMVRCWNYGNEYPEGIGNPPDSTPPPELDWDMWLGPAPVVPFNMNRVHKPGGWATFRYFWDYAGGKLTDWGTHHLDIIHWAMGVNYPKTVTASGGKYFIQDNRETPNTIDVLWEYPGFLCNYSYDGMNAGGRDGHGYGIQFFGTNGSLFLDRNGYQIYPEFDLIGEEQVSRIDVVKSGTSEQHLTHVRNFFDCVKTRKRPISDIEEGHYASAASLLGVIAIRSQQRLEWDGAQETITNAPELNEMLSREYRSPWKLPVL